jgi:hypothetical protein
VYCISFHCNIARFAERLVHLKENDKFRGEACKNFGDLVKKIKEKHGVKYLILIELFVLFLQVNNVSTAFC